MSPAQLRTELAAFLGQERFRKFVVGLSRKPRLRYWQELLWAQFIKDRPELDVPIEELCVALRICEVHNLELLTERVKFTQGDVVLSRRFEDACRMFFPHSASGPYITWIQEPVEWHDIWYCPACRDAQKVWESNQVY